MHSQQLLLCIAPGEVRVTSYQQELEVLGIHSEELHWS